MRVLQMRSAEIRGPASSSSAKPLAWLGVSLLAILLPGPALAQQAPTADVITESEAGSLDQLVRWLLLEHAPHNYERIKPGGTKRVWDGLHISTNGLRITTKRRWKEAKHGTWRRYRAWLIDPEREFDAQLENLRKTEQGQIAFDLVITARLGAFGRLSEWRRDVQLISIGVDAEARVKMRISCETSASLDYTNLPPDVVFEPVVTNADLQLEDFRVHRISDFDGPLVKGLGGALREVLEEEIQKRRAEMVAKINGEIADHGDDLRLSLHDLADSGWHEVADLLNLGDDS